MPVPTAPGPTLLDELVPTWDQRTLHGHSTRAPLEATASALREVTLGDARLARALIGIRSFGRLRGAALRRPWTDTGDGDMHFVLLGEAPHELALGTVGRPWPGGGRMDEPLADRAAFVAYVAEDTVKVAMSLRVLPADYGTLLLAETRIVVGPAARRPFGAYWAVVRLGSGLVRSSLLRAIALRAETVAAGAPEP